MTPHTLWILHVMLDLNSQALVIEDVEQFSVFEGCFKSCFFVKTLVSPSRFVVLCNCVFSLQREAPFSTIVS